MKNNLVFNKKNGRLYLVLSWGAINATNDYNQDNLFVVYKDVDTEQMYVREKDEFMEKFNPAKICRMHGTITGRFNMNRKED